MLDWLHLGNKNYPEFWRKYLSAFDIKTQRTIVLKIHTTGTDADKDIIISIAAVAIKDNAIDVGDSFEVIIAHRDNKEKDIKDHPYLDISIKEKVTEDVAIENFVAYIKNATIVGHRIDVDIEFLNEALLNLGCGKIKNEALDLEVMCRKWKDASESKLFTINDLRNELHVEKSERNSAIDDAFDLGLIFLKLKLRLGF